VTRGVVWAQAANRVIGRDGALPWHLPEDMAHFRALTAGATVLMGRRTWDSLPERFRPLPGRRNVVLTRSTSWTAGGAEAVRSVADGLCRVGGAHKSVAQDVWVIGGASVYAEALALVDVAVITELREPFEGDVLAPALGSEWVSSDGQDWLTSSTGLEDRFRRFHR
jgi:dihydrofolate reductase